MRPSKILADIIDSAIGAKAHYEIWWALANEAKPSLVPIMNRHSEFFIASADAHYTAFFVYLAHLFDKRSDSSSIPTYLRSIAETTDAGNLAILQSEYDSLSARAAPIVTARHKSVAHIDVRLTEREVFAPLDVTWNQVRDIVYDSAIFVAKLAGTNDLGSIGIAGDRRLIEATLKLIRAVGASGA